MLILWLFLIVFVGGALEYIETNRLAIFRFIINLSATKDRPKASSTKKTASKESNKEQLASPSDKTFSNKLWHYLYFTFKPKTKAQTTTLFAWALIAPAALVMFWVVVWPLYETFRLSFTNSNLATLMGGAEYVGWENYEKAIGGRKFPSIVTRTFYWMFLSVGLKVVLGLIGATLLASNIRGRGIFRALVMPPWIVPIAIGCFGWLWLYNGHFGLLSNFAEMAGITNGPFSFLAYKQSAFYSAVVTDVWIGTPMVTLFFLAAIQGVPRDLYEAAYVDGASRWYRFRRITMPQIMPTVISMALLSAIWTFNSFEIIWILTEGGPRGATTTLIIDTFKTAIFSYKFGAGATRAVLVCILLGVFSLIYLAVLGWLGKKYGYEGVQK